MLPLVSGWGLVPGSLHTNIHAFTLLLSKRTVGTAVRPPYTCTPLSKADNVAWSV